MSEAWRNELAEIDALMREVSRESDPQRMAVRYAAGTTRWLPADAWIGLSRRDLDPPTYRITRSTKLGMDINPWTQRDRLPPLFDRGFLGELLYADRPSVVQDPVIAGDDPAREFLDGYRLFVTLPQYDGGVALNMGVMLLRDPAGFPIDRLPMMVWQANLFGRATHNMVLRNRLKSAYEALDAEFLAVGQIQRSLLPSELPAVPTLDLAAHYATSQRAGGDYYDLFDLGDGRWGILIADVSGHGTPSAVIMAVTHAVAHLHPGCGVPPGELLGFVNRRLTRSYTHGNGTFVTAFYGIYDTNDRSLTYARAGHNPPRLLRDGRVLDLSQATGLPLGIVDDETYDEHRQELRSGDAVLFYTDGVTEAMSKDGKQFGLASLDRVLAERPCDDAAATIHRVLTAVDAFTDGAPAIDDRTMLAARVR